MDTILDYIKWRGDERFAFRPFCEVDAMVLCYLSYLDMKSGIKEGERLTIRDICHGIMEKDGGYNVTIVNGPKGRSELIDAIADSRRFGDLYIRRYRDIFDATGNVQFAAMTVDLDSRNSFIAFRGTDDSLAGWKEDFMISYTTIPGQKLAYEYTTALVNEDLKRDDMHNYLMGGHSKGGSLVLYAAASLPEDIRICIGHVYVFDCPGICREIHPDLDPSPIVSRTTHIRPCFSVIGGIFEPDIPDTRFVDSIANGMMQHDMSTWGIDHGHLAYIDEQDPGSVRLNAGVDQWIESADIETRKNFVEQLFDAFAASGYVRLQDIYDADGDIKAIEHVLARMTSLAPEVKAMALRLPAKILHSMIRRS